MNQLITITKSNLNNQNTNAVSARELHAGLELKTQFTDWVKQFLDDFIQGADFIIDTVTTVDVQTDGHRVTRNLVNYLFSLDMAKQVAMLTRTAKGKEVRLYFIECEKRLNKPLTRKEMALMVIAQEEEIERLQIQLDEAKDWMSIKKVAAHNQIDWKLIPWRKLKEVSMAMGYVPQKIFDANYKDGVNVYHKACWKVAYPTLNLPNGEC